MPYDIATLVLVTPIFKAVWAEALAQGLATDLDESARLRIASTLAAAVLRGGEHDPAQLTKLAMLAVIAMPKGPKPQLDVIH